VIYRLSNVCLTHVDAYAFPRGSQYLITSFLRSGRIRDVVDHYVATGTRNRDCNCSSDSTG
jgi:hypothetical protein